MKLFWFGKQVKWSPYPLDLTFHLLHNIAVDCLEIEPFTAHHENIESKEVIRFANICAQN